MPAVVSMNSIVNMLADDTALYADGKSVYNNSSSSLSNDLHRIADWFDPNSLSINTKKTLTMFLSHNSSHLTQDRTNSQISLRGHPLEKQTKVDYLEITIDDKLSLLTMCSRLLTKHMEHSKP